MKCEEYQNLFSEYYDGSTNKSGDIAYHLDRCPECKNDYELYRRILDDVASIKEPDVPDGLRLLLVSHAEGFHKGRKKHISIISHRFSSVFASMAAAAAAVLFVWYTGIFGTDIIADEGREMLVELALPQAAAERYFENEDLSLTGSFDDDDFPLARRFDIDDAEYDFVMGIFDEPYPYQWHYLQDFVPEHEEFSPLIITESHDFGFFEPIFIEVGYLGSPVVRPHFATAVLFLIIGLFLGYHIHRLVKYIERKTNNAP